MKDCPVSLRILVFTHLQVAELYREIVLVSRIWKSTLVSSEMVKELLRVNIGLELATDLPVNALIELLKKNAPGCFRARKPLPITGYVVSGGDDLTYLAQWMPAYLFSDEAMGYCSSYPGGNLVCGGFLSEVHSASHLEIASKAKNCVASGLLKSSRAAMVQEVELQDQSDSRMLACVHGVYVSRRGPYTCPLRSFVLFCSLEKLPIDSPAFAPFFDLHAAADVFENHRYEVVGHTAVANYEAIEFRRSPEPLQPILWGQFVGKRCTTIRLSLENRFLGRYFYILLIDPENRMRQMGDFHSFPNIDLHSVRFLGRVIALYH